MTGEKLKVGRTVVELSNTAKVLFPEDGITKGDLVAYYQAVAETMLPLLRDRPVSMTRFPDGITRHGIVQKNAPDYFPDWITRVRVRKEGGSLRQVVCDNPATIVYLANQAAAGTRPGARVPAAARGMTGMPRPREGRGRQQEGHWR